MQLAKLRSANNAAAEANVQQVTALSKLAAISMHVSVWFDSSFFRVAVL